MATRIVLADDHRIIHEGLRLLFQSQSDMEVVGSALNGREAVAMVLQESPDIVIMDVTMPELNGIDATRQILARHSHVKIIAFSVHTDRRIVRNMLQAGAVGYLLKECAFEELIHCVSEVMNGNMYLSPRISGIVLHDYLQQAENAPTTDSHLTMREREVLQLLTEGHRTRDIAERLQVSAKTIETHRKNIMDKLDLHSLPALTKYAVREGFTSL